MKKRRAYATALCWIFLVGTATAEDFVAIVDLKFLKETDQVAAVLCLGMTDDDCFPWAHHYLWEAKVRKVIRGTNTEKRFLVLHGRHALKKKDLRGVIALMKPLEEASPTGARYQLFAGEKREHFCFDKIHAEGAPIKLSDGERPLGCFSQ